MDPARRELHPTPDATLVADVVRARAPESPVCPEHPVWLFLHGFGSNRQGLKATHLLEWAAARGHGAVSVDQRFHGDSTGRIEDIRLDPMIDDAVHLLQEARSVAGSNGPLVAVGSSLGGLILIHALARAAHALAESVDLAVLIAPAFGWLERLRRYPRDAAGNIEIGNEWLRVVIDPAVAEAEDLEDESSCVARIRTPVVAFHGTGDDTVPVTCSRDLIPRFGGPAELVEIDGGDHRLADEMPRILEHAVSALGPAAEA